MVWPISQLPVAPAAVLSDGSVVRQYLEHDLSALGAVVNSDEPISDQAWETFRDRIIPGGAFLIVEPGAA
jgi:hypothetical protein